MSTVEFNNQTQPAESLESRWMRLKSFLGLPTTAPAVCQLAKWQSAAKFSRAIERIRSPRRLVLTSLAILLTFVWLGQAIAGIMLRPSASPADLLRMVPLYLSLYFVWNFIKVAGSKPVEPFEWTETERELLLGAPLRRSDVIQYRCSTIARSAFMKSLIFTFVMIPDLKILPLGFLGILLGLVFIDLVRIWSEIALDALKPRERFFFRFFVFGALAIVALRALGCTLLAENFAETSQTAAGLGFILKLWSEVQLQANTWFGAILQAPFRLVTSIIVAETLSLAIYAKLIICGLAIIAMIRATPMIDAFFGIRKTGFELANLESAKKNAENVVENLNYKLISAPSHFSGVGGLVWRQWRGALNHRTSVAGSLLVPAILSCMPTFATVEQFALVANTVGALAFYSLVLLPASLKFDFRRDLDRLTVLKSLPMSPLSVCIGQLAVPILTTLAFQLFTLLLVMCISPYNPLFILGGLLILLPFNVFIFAFENLAFLWYPHRINQEGMQVLIRSILVFTAKTLIFAIAFATTFLWVLLAKSICGSLAISWLTTPIVFSAGMFLLILGVSIGTFVALVRAFKNFDPSADLVGLD